MCSVFVAASTSPTNKRKIGIRTRSAKTCQIVIANNQEQNRNRTNHKRIDNNTSFDLSSRRDTLYDLASKVGLRSEHGLCNWCIQTLG